MPNLIVLNGLRKGLVVEIADPVTIGRSPHVDLRLPDYLLSQEHALVESGDEGFTLKDLESTNGTFRNGARVHAPTLLELGDVVHLGSTELLFTDRDSLDDSVLLRSNPERLELLESTLLGDEEQVDGATTVLPLIHAVERAFSRAPDLEGLLERVALHFGRSTGGTRVRVVLRRGEDEPPRIAYAVRIERGRAVREPAPERASATLRAALERQAAFIGPRGWVYAAMPTAQGGLGAIEVEAPSRPMDESVLTQLGVVANLAAVYCRNHLLVEEQAEKNRILADAQRRLTSWNEELQLAVAARTAEVERAARSYRELFEESQDGNFTVDSFGGLRTVNRRAMEVLGATGESSAEDVWELIGPDGCRALFGRAKMSAVQFLDWLTSLPEPRLVTFALQRAELEAERRVEILAARISIGEEGLGMHCVVRDVTLRHETEERMRLLSLVVESVPEAVVTFDADGVVTSWNPGARALYGYAAASVVGQLTPLVPDERVAEFERLLDAAKQGQSLSVRTVRVDENDVEIPVQSTIAPILDGAGTLRALVEITRDLRPQLDLEERMRWKERMASFGELAAGLAHEVGNPLANLLSGVELLLARAHNPSEAGEVHRVLRSEIKRLQRLVHQTLTLARWKAAELQPVQLGALLDFVADSIRHRAAESGVRVRREGPTGDELEIEADSDQLKQALVNLASNALDAIEGEGRLTLACELEGERALIEVRDTGRGIPADDLPRIYDLYYSRRPGGSGIGLSIVKRIVEAHHGRVELETEVGVGTTFRISLPRTQASEPE